MNVLRTVTMRSLQSRILALFLLLIVIVQVGGFVLIYTAGMSAARKTVGEALVAGARVFDRLLEQDTQRIVQGARLMSADYAFREVISTGDRDTIASVLANYGKRIDASLMMVIGLDQRVVSDTLGATVDKPFPFPTSSSRFPISSPRRNKTSNRRRWCSSTASSISWWWCR